jgi:hypothetical protein
MKLAFRPLWPAVTPMVPPSREPLDPALRARLLQEARTPWRGLRRALWLAFTASAALGLATMAMRASAGEGVPGSDLLIQVGALSLFGFLLWRDRAADPGDGSSGAD